MKLLAIAALVAAGSALSAEMTYKTDGATVRLHDQPCTLAPALALIREEYKSAHQAGVLEADGRMVRFCWVALNGFVYVVDEDGDMARLPISVFKREPGV